MRLEHYPVDKLKKEILNALAKHLDVTAYRVFFFGSRVTGKGTDRSDIDVGIEGPPIPPHIWFDIQEEFENFPTLYKVEIVDFNRVSPRFRDIASQNTEELKNKNAPVKI
ncbi:MAG: nucleotidyltransferase domain-containing protein [Candidatus Sungbacteria bacterium]|nr:nucleotidyltransferase domain-containing protein [Candidatus Sungbacteria bacterium]